MAILTGAISTATSNYLMYLSHVSAQFTHWGQTLFVSLITLNMMWFLLWLAFQKGEFDQNLVEFLKKFFMALLFYTLMIKHEWLLSLLQSAQQMGETLTQGKTDPSSIVNDGLWIACSIIEPIKAFNIFSLTFGTIIILVTYLTVIFVCLTVALRLAVTLIETTALIVVSSFFLSFAALSATSKIANNILEAIMANCAKLLGLYLVIGTGMNVIINLVNQLPQTESTFDDYWWLLSVVLLFWMLSKSIPDLFARIIGFAPSNDSHVDSAAIAMSVVKYSNIVPNKRNMLKKLFNEKK